MYWCYVDESWQDGGTEKVGVLAAAVGPYTEFEKLDQFMYNVRKKYIGGDHARDRRSELKGADLLSNFSFKMAEKHGYSRNLAVAREVFEWVKTSAIRFIGITAYGTSQPSLLAPRAKDLARPFKELCVRAKAAVPDGERGVLVFDQRVGAQQDISIAVYHYLAGMSDNATLAPHPLIGVSNVLPGLQLEDMAAYVLGRWATGDNRHLLFYKLVAGAQFSKLCSGGGTLHGLVRLQCEDDGTCILRRERLRP